MLFLLPSAIETERNARVSVSECDWRQLDRFNFFIGQIVTKYVIPNTGIGNNHVVFARLYKQYVLRQWRAASVRHQCFVIFHYSEIIIWWELQMLDECGAHVPLPATVTCTAESATEIRCRKPNMRTLLSQSQEHITPKKNNRRRHLSIHQIHCVQRYWCWRCCFCCCLNLELPISLNETNGYFFCILIFVNS